MTPSMKCDVAIAGLCAGCMRGIPHGYLYQVSRWRVIKRGNMRIMEPEEIWCKHCKDQTSISDQVYKRKRQRIDAGAYLQTKEETEVAEVAEVEEVVLTAKEVAGKIVAVMSQSEAMGSKKLSKLADLDYDQYGEMVLAVLKKLKGAGKVQLVDGRWML